MIFARASRAENVELRDRVSTLQTENDKLRERVRVSSAAAQLTHQDVRDADTALAALRSAVVAYLKVAPTKRGSTAARKRIAELVSTKKA